MSGNRTRILHVVESFGGGVFTSVTQIVNHLDPEAFDVGLVYSRRPQTPPDVSAFLRPHVRRWHLPMASKVRITEDLRAVAALTRLFRRERPDVVHLHSSKAGALGRVAARLAGVTRVFYSPRGFAFLRTDLGRAAQAAYRAAERLGAAFGGTVLACSQGEMEAARQVAADVLLVNNAIDLGYIDRLVPIDAGSGNGHGVLTVGISGRVAPQREPGLFAEVARQTVAAAARPVRFVWIGGGAVPPELAAARVSVTGWLRREEALSLLAREVDIYLHTSAWEGLPLAILEAMALGKPVVATDVVGNRDVVLHGVTGFLGRSAGDLAGPLRQLVADPGLRARLGAAGRARVERHFSLPVLMAALQGLYRGEPLPTRQAREAGEAAVVLSGRLADSRADGAVAMRGGGE